ncbi:hypothetical protein Tco_1190473 [Tanacetum coccineum]
MYYPRFTKVIVNFFMTKDQSIPRRNKVNWHFARDDPMFTTIKVVSRHEDTQLYGAILLDELTNEAIKDFESYKEYYAIASGAEPPKTKASVMKKQVESNKTVSPLTVKGKRLKTSAKAARPAKKKQPAKTSKAKGLTVLSEAALTKAEQIKLATKRSLIQTYSSHANGSGKNDDDDDNNDNDDDTDNQDDDDNDDDDGQDDENQDDDNEQIDSDNNGDDFVHPKFSTHDEEDKEEDSFDPRIQTPSHVESTDDEDSDDEIQGVNVEGEELDEEVTNEEDEANELYRDVNVNLEGRDTEMIDALRTIIQTTQVIEDTHVIITLVDTEGIDSIFNLITESTSLVDVPVTTIAEPPLLSVTILPPPPTPLITHLQQTPVPTPATVPSSFLQDLPNFVVSLILGIVDAYLANKMHEAVKIVVQLQSDRLRDEAQAENADFINKLDDNIKKIIKDQVKEQTTHVVVVNLSKLELKKILIDKMESNKSIHRSDEQKNLYKALVDSYESDKLILVTYRDIVSFKRRRDDEDKDEEASAGSNWGSKRRRVGKELESTSAPKEKTSKTTGKSTEGSKSHHKFQKPAKPFTLDRDWNKTLPDTHGPIQPWLSSLAQMKDPQYFFEEVYKATTDQLDWNNPEGQQYPHDLRKPLPLIPNSRGRQVIPFDHFSNNDLAYLSGGVSSQKYTTSVMKTKAADYGHIKWIKDLVPNRMESTHDVYSKCRIIVVTKLQIIEWHNYKNLDWITVRRDDDMLYKFKEGDFNRLRIQDIEDMLLLLVQCKLTNLTVEERLAFNFSLRMFTRSIVIQRRVEDLQLGVESYQKKLNLTKPDAYRSDLNQREAYTAYSNLHLPE